LAAALEIRTLKEGEDYIPRHLLLKLTSHSPLSSNQRRLLLALPFLLKLRGGKSSKSLLFRSLLDRLPGKPLLKFRDTKALMSQSSP